MEGGPLELHACPKCGAAASRSADVRLWFRHCCPFAVPKLQNELILHALVSSPVTENKWVSLERLAATNS